MVSQLIQNMVDMGILTFSEDFIDQVVRFNCGCGSKLKPNSISSHIKTKKHKNFIRSNDVVEEGGDSRECNICCENRTSFIYCSNNHETCSNCVNQMIEYNNGMRISCPMCRGNMNIVDKVSKVQREVLLLFKTYKELEKQLEDMQFQVNSAWNSYLMAQENYSRIVEQNFRI